MNKLAKLALTAAFGLAFIFTLSCDKASEDVKLLECFADESGKCSTKYEYDKKNRIVKIIYYSDDYSDGEPLSVTAIIYNTNGSVTLERHRNNSKDIQKYVKNGNTITISENESFTIDKDGYIVEWKDYDRSYTHKYENGNLIEIKDEGGYEDKYFSYDDKKSPFSNINAPKWLIQCLLSETGASKNNVTTYAYKGSNTYEYEYDSDGFPIKYTEWVGWNDETLPAKRLIYRGETQAVKEDKKHPIDIQYDKCMGEDAAPTTRSMTNCSAEAEKNWDSELNKNYKALMAELDKPEQEKLKLAQRKWIEYRDLAFGFTADYYERNGGSMQLISISINRMNFIRERALALKAYLDADKCDCEKTEKDWDSELNKNYKILMAELDKPEQEKLKLAQRKWIEYRDLEFNFMANPAFASCFRICFVRDRTLMLKRNYEEFHPEEQ